MKKKSISISVIFSITVLLVSLGAPRGWPGQAGPSASTLAWNTFNGGAGTDYGEGVAVDLAGNVYLTGYGNASWGTPVRPFGSENDAFLAKYNANGVLQWNTFLGGGGNDTGVAITVDGAGNVYVIGSSTASWGSPISGYSSGSSFVAKLNSDGALQWNTFVVGTLSGVAVNSAGSVYVTGYSNGSWGSPVNPHSSGDDAYVAGLSAGGALLWNTFLGGGQYDYGNDVALDGLGNIYVTGYSGDSWGTPIRPFTPGNNMLAYDAFAAKLNSVGGLQWNTFLGGSFSEYGYDIAVDAAGNAYVTGTSSSTWGSPLRSFGARTDAFAAKMSTDGALLWNTFLGGSEYDSGNDITVSQAGTVFVAGSSNASWGSPSFSFNGNNDCFAAGLLSDGTLSWNGFLGAVGNDIGKGIAISVTGGLYVTGTSLASWGSPIQAFGADYEAFVAKIALDPSLVLTSPNGGEIWGVDSVHDITWAATGAIANVMIEYSSNNGANWATVIASTPNDGAHSWTIPAPVTSTGLVRVTDAANAARTDTSNAVFSVAIGTPAIGLSKTSFAFGTVQNGTPTPAGTSILTNTGTGTLSWSVAATADWISAAPASGTDAGLLTIGIARTDLAAGNYFGTVTVSDPAATNSPQVITIHYQVIAPGMDAPPFGFIETPVDGATVRSSIAVTGWALDDIGMQSVKIYRGTGLADRVFIGDATFVEGARLDVVPYYPDYPQNTRAGWGYMLLTNFLPNGGNGAYNLLIYAADVSGHEVFLGNRTITCDNANATLPFGAIDTPAQGGTAAGSGFFNFGWALTPQPNFIPTDGSTILVWVNGAALGNPDYGYPRGDIQALFPGYQNTNTAVGVYDLNTTLYPNGVHNIAWSVQDSAGNTDGIGSRFFSISNMPEEASQGAPFARPADAFAELPEDTRTPVFVRRGMGLNDIAEMILPEGDGSIRIDIPQVTRVAVYLNEVDSGERGGAMIERGARILRKPAVSDIRYEAYRLVFGELGPLPIGASFDVRDGVLYWQPGPGFLGEYQIVIVDRNSGAKKTITISIGAASR